MGFEEFAKTAQGIATAFVSAVGALTAFYTARTKWRVTRKQERRDAQPPNTVLPIVAVAVGGIFLGLTVAIIATRFASRGPIDGPPDTASTTSPAIKPAIALTEPVDRSTVAVTIDPNGSGRFIVRGTSTGLASDPLLRVYVLVHPENPFGEGFWIQREPATSQNGTWSGLGWIGTRGFEAKPGDTFWVTAIVARRQDEPRGPDGQAWVGNPSQLSPLATATAHATVAQTR
jgi:hypothetical protein